MTRKFFFTVFLVLALALTFGTAQAQFFMFDNPLVGEYAPDFTLDTLNAKSVKFSEAKGQDRAILFFWATWCPHCREALIDLTKNAREIEAQGIRVILVDLGETAREVRPYIEKKKVPFEVFIDGNSDLSDPYNIIGVPTFVFVGEDGVVRAVEHSLPDRLDKIFTAP